MIGKYFVLLVTIGAAAAVKPVPVTIYYETLCEDSMKFFTKQLLPTWNDLKAYISPLTLVPYGKTTVIPATGNQNVSFICHHGENECLGNKFQSCLLDPVYRINLEDQLRFIDCLMTDAKKEISYDVTARACKKKVNVDVELLVSCAKTVQGDNLLITNGVSTDSMQKPLASVPTIVFNNQLNSDDTVAAVKSFRGALCKYITDNPKPAACNVNGAPITTIGAMTLFTAGLFVRLL